VGRPQAVHVARPRKSSRAVVVVDVVVLMRARWGTWVLAALASIVLWAVVFAVIGRAR